MRESNTLSDYFQDPINRVSREEAMRHGNEKTEFETGAHRDTDEGKGKPSLISPVLIHRLGVLLSKGAKHYGADNWTKGMPFRRTLDSIVRHTFLELAGDTAEDHAAAIAFGAMCLMHFQEGIKSGSLPASLDDRNPGLKKILPSILTSPPSEPRIEIRACFACGRAGYEPR
ncbi:hypothetical protein LCGC14_0549140 [marine sediment metagenome]|uniref:dATP/dGTP diphosphohydrolase N-terminal domain-containing protein n=1 Tax=marine sediment metagenome TaxID=412755 RepID=A0A0F9UBU7_9ZZZZ